MKNGKGILYSKEGDMEIGDYLNDNKIGKHIIIYVMEIFLQIIMKLKRNHKKFF